MPPNEKTHYFKMMVTVTALRFSLKKKKGNFQNPHRTALLTLWLGFSMNVSRFWMKPLCPYVI